MTRTKRLLLAFATIVGAAAGSGLPLSIRAQETKEGIGISPTSLTLAADAGQEITGEVTVINPGDESVSYRLYASNFRIRNEEYEKDFDLDDPETTAPVSWFDLPDEPGRLEGQGQQKVSYTIRVPQDAASQGYYGVIFAETMDEKADASGVTRRKRVGSLVYLTVNGAAVNHRARLVSFDVPRWQRSSPVKATVRLGNEGNVHYQVAGELRLKNLLGRTVQTATIDAIVVPDTIRKLSYELAAPRAAGIYRVEGHVSVRGQSSGLKSKWVMVASPLWLVVWALGLLMLIISIMLIKKSRRGRAS